MIRLVATDLDGTLWDRTVTVRPDTADIDVGVQVMTMSKPPASSDCSMVTGSRASSMPHTRMRRPSTVKSSASTAAAASAPSGLWAPSRITKIGRAHV